MQQELPFVVQNPLAKIFAYAVRSQSKALWIVEAPTGAGKTYEIASLMAKTFDKKFLYISTKKSTVHSAYKEFMAHCDSRQKEKSLYLKSEIDMMADFIFGQRFQEIFGQVPQWCRTPLQEIKKRFAFLKTFEQSTISSLHQSYLNESIRELRQIIRGEVRSEIKEGKNITQILQEYRAWLKAIFPTFYLSEYSSIFVNIHKFMVGYHTLLSKESFLTTTKESVLFFDEFDSLKRTMGQILLQKQREENLIQEFKLVAQGLLLNKPPSVEKIKALYKDFGEYLEELLETYKLSYPIHNGLGERGRKAFMLADGDLILSKYSGRLGIKFYEDEEMNKIVALDSSDPKISSLIALANRLKYALDRSAPRFFDSAMRHYLQSPLAIKEQIEKNEALSTLFYRFNYTQPTQEKLYDRILSYNIHGPQKLRRDKTNDFWDRGYSLFFLQESSTHREDIFLKYHNVALTPEFLLFHLTKRNLVIGISATAAIEAIAHNFNLRYLQKKLGTRVHTMSEAQKEELQDYLKKMGVVGKKEIDYHVRFFPQMSAQAYLGMITNIGMDFGLDEKSIMILEERIQGAFMQGYDSYRTALLVYLLLFFLQERELGRMRSFFYFGNKIGGMEEILKEVLDIVAFISQVDKEELEKIVLLVDTQGYRQREKEIKSMSEQFVVTTYKSLMEGINIEHAFDPKLLQKGDVCCTGKRGVKNYFKDIDGIYLEKPTYFFDSAKDYKEDLFLYLNAYNYAKDYVQCPEKFIDATNYLNQLHQRKKRDITAIIQKSRGLCTINTIHAFFEEYLPNILSYEVVRIVIQTLGRLNRKAYKNAHMYLFLDDYFTEHLSFFGHTSAFKRGVYTDEFRAVVQSAQERSTDSHSPFDPLDFLTKSVGVKNIEMRQEIEALLEEMRSQKRWKRKKAVQDWVTLRQIVLTNPSLDSLEEILLPNQEHAFVGIMPTRIYEKMPKKSKGYIYEGEVEGDIRSIGLYGNFQTSRCVCPKTLEMLMQIGIVRAWFEQKGYATRWKKGSFLMVPVVFNNIYQGALGEEASKSFFAHFGLELQELEEYEYEIFDARYGRTYFDFKCFSDQTIYNHSLSHQLLEKTIAKMQERKIQKVLLVNACAQKGGYSLYTITGQMARNLKEAAIVSLHALFDFESKSVDSLFWGNFKKELFEWIVT